ncbi:HlyD family secretion protein [Aquisphaera insulae]|uniref:HlyD family secretion protein n=1 Tax=Aquisphaera insulae TaxID=2712864 RepID=UPI0013EDCFCE|nr:HlyD family secretion protein [Aquisphaera insulae]
MNTEQDREVSTPASGAAGIPPSATRKDAPGDAPEASPPTEHAPPSRPSHPGGRRLLIGLVLVAAIATAVAWSWPRLVVLWNSEHTDDAYVAGHVTYVAPRVAGTILEIRVDDNDFVKKGDLLVELDPELYRVAEGRAAAAVAVAEAQLVQARSQAKAVVAGLRAAFNNLILTTDGVVEGIAKLKASLATQAKAAAQRSLAEAELRRARNLLQSNSGTQQVVDQREASYQVAAATELEAQEQVHLARAALGLPSIPPAGQAPGDVPADWIGRAPAVRASLAELINVAVKLGIEVPPIEEDPKTVIENFRKKAPGGDQDAYLNQLAEDSPPVRLAKAGIEQASRALDQARIDLRDTRIHAEFDGIIGRRVANPGNRVQAGQGLMMLRSLDEIWIDANFKETQIAEIAIGQPVEIAADAYPGRTYRGRVSGFAPGTGAATALLPPENATGNFVKVVQRLPVRIDLVDGNPAEAPLFVGLSVEPRVLIRATPTGPFAGRKLRRPVAEEARATAPEPSR